MSEYRMLRFSILFIITIVSIQLFTFAEEKSEAKPAIDADYRFTVIPEKAIDSEEAALYIPLTELDESRLHFAVTDLKGNPVRFKILWQVEGEPVKLILKLHKGTTKYHIYISSKKIAPAPVWNNVKALIFTSFKLPEIKGKIGSWKKAKKIFAGSKEKLGASVVNRVHHGIHMHGETYAFMSHFKGSINIKKSGNYGFATMSDDASVLLINNKVIAMAPDKADVRKGRRGRFSGYVDLTAGWHRFEYYNIQRDHGFSVTAAWKAPGQKYFTVIPAEAFAGVSLYKIENIENLKGSSPLAYYIKPVNYCSYSNITTVGTKFDIAAPEKVKYSWEFDNGKNEAGSSITQVFASTGMRQVLLSKGNRRIQKKVNIKPFWQQQNSWDNSVWNLHKLFFLNSEPGKLPLQDLVNLTELALKINQDDLLIHNSAELIKRKQPQELLHRIALYLQKPELKKYDIAEQCFRASLMVRNRDKKTAAQSMLHLAGMLIHVRIKPAEGLAMLDNINDNLLSNVDKRLKQIFKGDGLLSENKVDRARKVYEGAGTVVERGNLDYSVRRRARLEAAKDYVRRGEYTAAESIIRGVEWETPLERIGTETGLIMIDINTGRKEYEMAESAALRLLNASDKSNRDHSAILYKLYNVYIVTGNDKSAKEVRKVLLENHPYSEAAARILSGN
ncbi:MAG: PA14 domain-containing protein [Planctomycetota bacterium]|jgi:hypothetical protein